MDPIENRKLALIAFGIAAFIVLASYALFWNPGL
jgi:hypothetical protein